MNISNRILTGDALTILQTMPSNHVQTVITSPPYYGLRDYGVDGQLGLEAHPSEYVEVLVQVFREVRRVLRQDGTLWLNLGDSYAAGKAGRTDYGDPTSTLGPKHDGLPNNTHPGTVIQRSAPAGFKPKDLMMIPARVAIALQDDGWYLRSDIIWSKNNAMPESVQDRPTKSHEYIFLLSKSERYYYDADAIAEPAICVGDTRHLRIDITRLHKIGSGGSREKTGKPQASIRNKRSVWTVSTQPYSEAHFATFPPKLIEPCILAGSRPGDIVLDPFMGAGTVALVAIKYDRSYLGIELNPEYVALTERRIATVQQDLWSVAGESEAGVG